MKKVCKECDKKYAYGEGIKHRHGKNNPFYGFTHTLSSRKIMKQNHADVSGENNPNYGKHLSEETKRKISILKIGTKASAKTKRKLSIARIGKKRNFSKETRDKLSNNLKKRWEDGSHKSVGFGNSKRGYRNDLKQFFRSTWEANFARILNYQGIKYEYELTIFKTPLGFYTPDFYLSDQDIYVEMKGWEGDGNQRKKRLYCVWRLGIKILIVKRNRYRRLARKYSPMINYWEV